MSNAARELTPEELRFCYDPTTFAFECTDGLTPIGRFIGQDRALRSIQFGMKMRGSGFNLFVTGLTGTGKRSAIERYVEEHVRQLVERKEAPEVCDWVYVHNFQDPDRPRCLRVSKGRARELAEEMDRLGEEVKRRLRQAFSSDEYREARQAAVSEAEEKTRGVFAALDRDLRGSGFGARSLPDGIVIFPVLDDQPVTPEQFSHLPEARRQEIEDGRRRATERVEAATRQVHEIEGATRERLWEMDRETGRFHLSTLFAEHLAQYAAEAQVREFVEHLRDYTIERVEAMREAMEEGPERGTPFVPHAFQAMQRVVDPFLPFSVNVFVTRDGETRPPVVTEPNPTWIHLFGQIERRAVFGTYVSDHTMLKPGALQRANGGFLVLNAKDVLTNPGVWEGLKRALRNREVRLEDPVEQFGLAPPQGLRPEPLPLDVKVIVLGDDLIYRLLSILDQEEFGELFKVKAEFDSEVDRTPSLTDEYAGFICGVAKDENIRHFDRSGVAKVMECASRMVDDQRRLSARFGQVRDLLLESNFWAGEAGASVVSAAHVEQAFQERFERVSLIKRHVQRLIKEGTVTVEVDGTAVGQVNGLTVYDMGDFRFGRPVRLTVATFAGRKGVINIEREVHLSGPIHDKGMLILSGYLGWKYAQERPLSLSVSVVFEQSYAGVEGDSASSTELYAIVSRLADVPIRQGVAVTGSVDQRGHVQPIGGVNEKIEGFFDVCQAKGLTREQGVLIPAANIPNLMLREEVVEAVRRGDFHVWAVETIDQGIEVLTGVPAGERRPDGVYPPGTVNALAKARLDQFAESLRTYEWPSAALRALVDGGGAEDGYGG